MSETAQFSRLRLFFLIFIMTVFFLILSYRLLRLQVMQSETYLQQSETNRMRIVEVAPLRGLMFDRNQNLLVDNYPSYELMVVPKAIHENPAAKDTLLALIGLEEEEFDRRLGRIRKNLYKPVRILHDVSFSLYAAIEERKIYLPGVSFEVHPKRAYLYNLLTHTLGHIGELKESDSQRRRGLEAGDIIGLSGIEQVWNDSLMGKKGYLYKEVDVVGRIIGDIPNVAPIPPVEGADIILSIDLELQRYSEELLGENPGSVVAIEPATGEVLVLASKPDYPPETFANVLTQEQWKALQEDPDTPLIHRAVQGVYPPGSIFKMGVLGAGLQTATIDTNWSVTCVGGYQLGRRWFKCWNKAGHGEVKHRTAIESSCDVYFYLLGLKLGIDKFHTQLSQFGFGSKTGIDLPHESEGLLPSGQYFRKRYGENWSEGHLFNIAIGQGEVLVSPLQAAVYTACLANNGWWKTPHLVKGTKHGETIFPVDEVETHKVSLDSEVIDILRRDMLRVTEGPRGTAKWLYDPRVQVAGKTGTAQNAGEDHAWFVAFAPYDDPKIAVAVLVEFGEHGSTAAAPIAYKVIRKHLGLDEETWQQYRWKIIREQQAAREALEETPQE
ncbi:penicillin-binding protein 2 [bacterium]|nr:penicillin-binding protein 2 [bacterium]